MVDTLKNTQCGYGLLTGLDNIELANMDNIKLANMNNVELVSMNNVELANMNNVELASMNNVELVSMNNVVNNVVTILISHHCCDNLLIPKIAMNF